MAAELIIKFAYDLQVKMRPMPHLHIAWKKRPALQAVLGCAVKA